MANVKQTLLTAKQVLRNPERESQHGVTISAALNSHATDGEKIAKDQIGRFLITPKGSGISSLKLGHKSQSFRGRSQPS